MLRARTTHKDQVSKVHEKGRSTHRCIRFFIHKAHVQQDLGHKLGTIDSTELVTLRVK
jgi:hypothetical protein